MFQECIQRAPYPAQHPERILRLIRSFKAYPAQHLVVLLDLSGPFSLRYLSGHTILPCDLNLISLAVWHHHHSGTSSMHAFLCWIHNVNVAELVKRVEDMKEIAVCYEVDASQSLLLPLVRMNSNPFKYHRYLTETSPSTLTEQYEDKSLKLST
jgi:hypothetical protein